MAQRVGCEPIADRRQRLTWPVQPTPHGSPASVVSLPALRDRRPRSPKGLRSTSELRGTTPHLEISVSEGSPEGGGAWDGVPMLSDAAVQDGCRDL
jgi:hypothetical protein